MTWSAGSVGCPLGAVPFNGGGRIGRLPARVGPVECARRDDLGRAVYPLRLAARAGVRERPVAVEPVAIARARPGVGPLRDPILALPLGRHDAVPSRQVQDEIDALRS